MFKRILLAAGIAACACGPAAAGVLAKGALSRVAPAAADAALARPAALPYWLNYDLTLYPKQVNNYVSRDATILSTAASASAQAAANFPNPPDLPGLAAYTTAVVDPLTAGGLAVSTQPPPPRPRFPGENAPTVASRSNPGASR